MYIHIILYVHINIQLYVYIYIYIYVYKPRRVRIGSRPSLGSKQFSPTRPCLNQLKASRGTQSERVSKDLSTCSAKNLFTACSDWAWHSIV